MKHISFSSKRTTLAAILTARYSRFIVLLGLATSLVVAMIPIPAHASSITSTLLAFSATGAFAYDSVGVIGGSGAGFLTAPVGSLPAGTQVDWNITGYLVDLTADPATISGNTVTQTFFFPQGYSGMSVTVHSDGSTVLYGDNVNNATYGYATGTLGSTSAVIEMQFQDLASGYFSPPSTAVAVMTGTTSVPIGLDPSCFVCPSITPFDLDWSFALANPTPSPEPGSLVLLGTGMIGVTGAVRRRLKK